MTTHAHGKAVLDELRPPHREFRHAIPDVYEGFGELHKAAFTADALDAKTKEFIALAIVVTFLMNGGPATTYGPRAYEASCEFTPEPDA